jgi:hypothetical protein
VHLFVPETKGGLAEVSGHDMPDDEDHGWRAVVGQDVVLQTVQGDHFTMMVDSASDLARQLRILIDRVAVADEIACDRKHRQPAVTKS